MEQQNRFQEESSFEQSLRIFRLAIVNARGAPACVGLMILHLAVDERGGKNRVVIKSSNVETVATVSEPSASFVRSPV